MSAAHRFAEWMHATRNTVTSAAEALHCTPSHITHLRRGRRTPGLGIALAIERMTAEWEHGPIRTAEWHDAKAPTSREVA